VAVAFSGNDHRLGANEAPPAIISIFLGDMLTDVFEQIKKGGLKSSKQAGTLTVGVDTLPGLPKDSGDRNRTSPFAFTGNKFEFRALGSSQSPSLPNTVLNTIVAESIDSLCEDLEAAMGGGRKKSAKSVETALTSVIGDIYKKNRKIVFGGDNYSEEWHKEAGKRGLANLRTTPDALPELISKETVAAFSNYGVLSERELHSRYDVMLEQYVITVNTEAETAADIASTMILPAAARHLAILNEAGLSALAKETTTLINAFTKASKALQKANLAENHPTETEADAAYMRDTVLPAMDAVREAGDALERVVADDLWPLPKYSEMLFIK
jgi:glutamine synthetase